ncbi:Hypothetical predicted protein [Mytilus galloprovincialis]|uniref:PHD-type domain-containing protein n=1 Tax=Mytilus galloprovincialis TaxID=29158 RepID=A0A8B6HUL9_MYTGA|nr:Hypothetical predicted protein [Mytilus galloprovincialis]
MPRWPCGTCGKNVTWKCKALECDSCKTWYHVDCQGGMQTTMYNIMDNSNLSWNCIKCGLPNFSSSFFNQTDISSSVTNNSFSLLSDIGSPGQPHACSSPISQKDIRKQNKKDHYTVFRKDRPPNKKGQCHGGVLIAISNNYLCTEIKELDTGCEMIWVELSISNARKCYICAYYRPQPDDDTSLDLLNESISRINVNSKSAIIIGGDFNLGNINWETTSVIPGKPNQKQHQQFLDMNK